jgi:hypothetical protein
MSHDVLQVEKTDVLADECIRFVENYDQDDYFGDLALFLADKLNVSYVLIGYLLPENNHKIRTVVLVAKGQVVDNMTYSLYGTPCENVVGRNCCYFPSNVRKLFPDDKELQDLNIESYIGSPLCGENKEPLGLIVLMNETIIRNAASVEKALQAISGRTERALQKYVQQFA